MTREQLEQEAVRNRAEVADTLEELNKRLTPGEILDQVLNYSKDGGLQFLGNLGKQMTDNPMPVTLIGAGLAWFLFGKNAGGSRPNGNGYGSNQHMFGNSGTGMNMKMPGSGIGDAASAAADKIGGMASATASGVSGAMHSVGDAASGAMHSVGDAATGAMHSVGDAASSAYSTAADQLTMVKNSAMQAEERTMAAARSAITFCQDQPLILAGAGLALGAAIGAALPSTELENRLLGESSDEMKETAKDIAVDQLDKAKAIGGKFGEALKDEAEGIDASEDDDTSQDDEASQVTSQYARPNGGSGTANSSRTY